MAQPNPTPDPIDDAEKIRLKRLAKLASSSSPITSVSPKPSPSPRPASIPQPSKYNPHPGNLPSVTSAAKRKALPEIAPLHRQTWTEETLENIFLVTLHGEKAVRTDYQYVWLKFLYEELQQERGANCQLMFDDVDRIMIARLEVDPNVMSDDLDYLPVLASLPPLQTVLEYLLGCWKRVHHARSTFKDKNRSSTDAQYASDLFEKTRDLIISYIGLTMQDPSMFPQPNAKVLGALELLPSLLSLATLGAPYSAESKFGSFGPSDVNLFLSEFAQRFPTKEDGLDDMLSPVVDKLLFHETLFRSEGLAGGDVGWRTVLAGLGVLVGQPNIAKMITRMDSWCPEKTEPAEFEKVSLMGPLLRLGVFEREWPQIAKTYFSDAQNRSRADVDGSNSSLRATLGALQDALFQVFNSIVRAGPDAREQVLRYFSRAINLNVKRGGMQVDYSTVSTDGYLINIQAILMRFAEPFMDVKFSKLNRVELNYLDRPSSRLTLPDETRINATIEEIRDLSAESNNASPPNFITEIFYLTAAMNHFGLIRTIEFEQQLHKAVDDRQGMIDRLNNDPSWQNTPLRPRVEADIERLKNDIARLHSEMFAYQSQLLDPGLISKALSFAGFMSTWLISIVDPLKKHPARLINLPLPREVPAVFRMIPEFFLEDIAELYLYLMRHQPDLIDVSAQVELINLCLTFLTSTWYIKNPFLKAKLVQILFFGTLGYNRDRQGLLNPLLNSNALCLEHLMPALTGFYIEIESTGSHTQFYDKFNARRDIAYILNAIWHTHGHRDALKRDSRNHQKFTRFINLMMNDVTFLLDESLSKLSEISSIQKEMEHPEWRLKAHREQQERVGHLSSLESQATSWLSLGKSTVDLLDKFTRETAPPFMTPEIVNRLAAMLDYNLEALVGPKCRDLKVKNPEKYRFNPRQLLSDILNIYLNLSGEQAFVHAVANDERSYRASLFERAASIAKNKALKTDAEIDQLLQFVREVETAKVLLEAEEDTEGVPEEYLDPLMFTVMRDPVVLPSSRAVVDRSTIKAHLLSDTHDPFNRVPLNIEDVTTDVELKEKILAFLSDRRERRKQLNANQI